MKWLGIMALGAMLSTQAQALELNCTGTQSDFLVTLQASWTPGVELSQLALNEAGNKSSVAKTSLESYHPRNPAYKNMNRFEIGGDGWSTTSILLPMTVSAESFLGYYYDQGHSGVGTLLLNCTAR